MKNWIVLLVIVVIIVLCLLWIYGYKRDEVAEALKERKQYLLKRYARLKWLIEKKEFLRIKIEKLGNVIFYTAIIIFIINFLIGYTFFAAVGVTSYTISGFTTITSIAWSIICLVNLFRLKKALSFNEIITQIEGSAILWAHKLFRQENLQLSLLANKEESLRIEIQIKEIEEQLSKLSEDKIKDYNKQYSNCF